MRIHFVGILGTGTSGAAAWAHALGHEVTGSDDRAAPPIERMLRLRGIGFSPYDRARLEAARPDLVIFANSVPSSNQEIRWTLDRGIPFTSFARFLGREVAAETRNVVVAGTHGKGTIVALVTHWLAALDKDPRAFVGGVMRNTGESIRFGNGPVAVLEGDEYASAHFDPTSKLQHFDAETLVLNCLEWDHPDYFKSAQDVETFFARIVEISPRLRTIVANFDDAATARALAGCTKSIHWVSQQRPDAAVLLRDHITFGMRHSIELETRKWGSLSLTNGAYLCASPQNVALALAVVQHVIGDEVVQDARRKLQDAYSTFEGLHHRLEVRTLDPMPMVWDYAHHPTAIRRSIEAVRSAFIGKRIAATLSLTTPLLTDARFRRDVCSAMGTADAFALLPPGASAKDRLEMKHFLRNHLEQGYALLQMSTDGSDRTLDDLIGESKSRIDPFRTGERRFS